MRRNFLKCILTLSFILFVFQSANASIVNIDFNPTIGTSLDGSVYGFQFDVISDDPAWTFTSGDAVASDWFFFSDDSPVQGFSTDGVALASGRMGTLSFGDTYSLAIANLVLSDLTGTPGAFVEGIDFFVNYNGVDTYTVSSVPIPSALLLLGSGLVGLVTFRRRKA